MPCIRGCTTVALRLSDSSSWFVSHLRGASTHSRRRPALVRCRDKASGPEGRATGEPVAFFVLLCIRRHRVVGLPSQGVVAMQPLCQSRVKRASKDRNHGAIDSAEALRNRQLRTTRHLCPAVPIARTQNRYQMLSNMPIIGLVLRIVYAALSPFPFFGFSQWQLYGGNELFLVVHLFSAIFSIWLVISAFYRLRNIVSEDPQVRVVVMFGLSILASLAFSAIGFHAYIAPALPFLAVVLLRQSTRVPVQPAAGFVLVMEVVAQMARLGR